MKWSVEPLDDVVAAELEALPDDMLARFVRIVDLIENMGLEHLREPT